MKKTHNDHRRRALLFAAPVVVVLAAAVWLVDDVEHASAGLTAGGRSSSGGPAIGAPVLEQSAGARDATPTVVGGVSTMTAEPLADAAPVGHFGPVVQRAGRTATLDVEVSERGLGTVATLTVVAGADAGHQAQTDFEGRLVIEDLVPGLATVEVVAASGVVARRDVLLRHRKTHRLALDFGDHGVVVGKVRDSAGVPLPGASVALDGLETATDEEGNFTIARHVAGVAPMTVRRAGFATQCIWIDETHVYPSEPSPTIRLEPAARLTVHVPPAPIGAGDVQLVLVPEGDPRAFASGTLRSTYPWSALAPRRVVGGTTVVFDDLPSCRVDVLAFHESAEARPLSGWCRPAVDAALTVDWKPGHRLEVIVRRGERPVDGARAEIAYTNLASERLLALGNHRGVADSQPIGYPPHLFAHVVSDGSGRCALPRPRRDAYLRVRHGETTIVRPVSPRDTALVVDLLDPGA